MKTLWHITASLVGGMLTAMSCVSCVADATDDETSNDETTDTEHPDTQESELITYGIGRTTMKYMAEFSTRAYDPGIAASNGYVPSSLIASTSVTKVWVRFGVGADDFIVIGFAGTHPTDIGDIILDVKSQAWTTPKNPLDNSLPSVGQVGQGWSTRWTNQAAQTGMAAYFAKMIASHKLNGRGLRVFVTGHSLGGATATLAAFDIAQYFKAHAGGVPYAVDAITFDSPRLGYQSAVDNYRKALLGSSCPGANGKLCLRLKQLTRDLDPVQSLPLGEQHAVWSPTAGDKRVGPGGTYAGQSLPYCPQLNAPKLSSWNGLTNHSLAGWPAQIDAAPDSQIFCN